MGANHRSKILKPLVINTIKCFDLPNERLAQFHKIMQDIYDGRESYVILHGIPDTKIILGKSPKSQKKIRIAL